MSIDIPTPQEARALHDARYELTISEYIESCTNEIVCAITGAARRTWVPLWHVHTLNPKSVFGVLSDRFSKAGWQLSLGDSNNALGYTEVKITPTDAACCARL